MPKNDKAESKTETLRRLREGKAVKTDKDKKGKEAKKAEKKDNKLVVMKGYEVLPALKQEERKEKANDIDKEFRSIEKDVRAKGLRAGILLREMRGYELWKELKSEKTSKPFTSFDGWLKEAAPVSRAGGYAQLKMVDKLLPVIPKEELAAMPDFARKLLAKVPKQKFEKVDSAIRKAARTAKTPRELTDVINQHAPEAHIEQKRVIKLDISSAGVIMDAIQAAQVVGEIAENEVYEYLATEWFDAPCQREDCSGMTNRQAWYAITQRSNVNLNHEQAEAV